jgi:hypothetical protein
LPESISPAIRNSKFQAIKGKKEDIQWVLPTSRSSAAIAAKSSLSPLRSKNFFSRKVTLMNRSVAFRAVSPGKRRKAEDPEVQCRSSRLFALNVGKRLKYPSNPDRADRYIAAPATAR